MKHQQFEQQVEILKLHHSHIQSGIRKLKTLVTQPNLTKAERQAVQVSDMTCQLFKYCQQLLHTAQSQSKKCDLLRQRLMRAFKDNKSSMEQVKNYEERLRIAQKKIQLIAKQKREVQNVNANLKAEIKLAGFVSSFTFKDESIHKAQPPKLQNSEINSISESQVHQTSLNSQSQQEDIQLYVSVLDQIQQTKNKYQEEIEEVQQQLLKDIQELKKVTPSIHCNE